MEQEVQKFACNYPYIVPVKTDEHIQYYVAAERVLFAESKSLFSAILNLISVYFTFNIMYPKPLYSLFIFVQHIVLLVKDSQHTPTSVTSLVSALDKL